MSLSSYINHCNFNEININYTNEMGAKNNNYYNINSIDKDNSYFRVVNPDEQQELNKNVINSCGDNINSSNVSYESDVLQREQFLQEFLDDKLSQQKSVHYNHHKQHIDRQQYPNNQHQQDTYQKQQLSIPKYYYDYKTFNNISNEFSTPPSLQNEQQSIDVLMQQQKSIYQQQQDIFNKLQQQQQTMHHNEQLQDDYSLQQDLLNNQQYYHPDETQRIQEEQKLIFQQYQQKQQDVIHPQQIYSQNSHTNNDHKKDNCTLFLQCNIQQQQYSQSGSQLQIQPSTKQQQDSIYHQVQPNVSQITNINFPVFINNYDKNNSNNSKNHITISEQRNRKSDNGGSNDTTTENVKGSKRCRQTYTNTQTKILEKTFSITQYVTRDKRMDLASTINLSEGQIKVWFQNRRMKEKTHGNRI